MIRCTTSPEPISAFYVRNARRLRAQFASQPGRMHRALRELTPPSAEPLRYNPTPAERFAARVINDLEGNLLRYSARLSLLNQAAEMGIERFEANLIIAAVQHGRAKPVRLSPNRPIGTASLVLAFAVVQVLILTAVWWIFSA